MAYTWQVLLILCALVMINHVVSEEHHRRYGENRVSSGPKFTRTTKGHEEHESEHHESGHHESHEYHEDHDSDRDSDRENFKKLCKKLCSGENSDCPHDCAQAYLDPWVGRRRR